ncbi:MAG: restriction system-associated AAA family ATPase [Alistipes sp.]|nr:restriction system-associated AAA family ATPase [Alistipes sp.]
MKLLKFEIGESSFRSLYPGFQVVFRDENKIRQEELETFGPFCMAGLNGTGKSNVLEALAAIFYHLECCVDKFRPESFRAFRRDKCFPDAYCLEYLIQPLSEAPNAENFDFVRIIKKVGTEPRMYVCKWRKGVRLQNISLRPKSVNGLQQAAEGKRFLPDIVVGYSSGENEILSIPFIKSRLINFDKYCSDYRNKYRYEEPENSLIYVDETMSQAVLLACMMFEKKETTLEFLERELQVRDIASFRMHINEQVLQESKVSVTDHIVDIVEQLKAYATCWYRSELLNESADVSCPVLILDFWVNDQTKEAFRLLFHDALSCFRFFQTLYELNANFLPESIKEEVYTSQGVYTQGKLPEPSPTQDVFHFLDFMILKNVGTEKRAKKLLLREFSDGEHQFLHAMGICLMLKNKRCLMLLDEPETHFNPEWRSKFVETLDRSLQASACNNLQKEIILTSHSSYILSDCRADKVLIFQRKDNNVVSVQSAEQVNIRTYGTSANLLNSRIFQTTQTVGDHARRSFDRYYSRLRKEGCSKELIREIDDEMGDSIEKELLIGQFIGQ